MGHWDGGIGNLLRRVRMWLQQRRFHAELADEVRTHLSMRAEELARDGVAPADAALDARRRFGSTVEVTEAARRVWITREVDMIGQELRYAWRNLRRAPGFVTVALLTLGVGIGGTVAIFSVLNSALFRPLPFSDADRIAHVHITAQQPGGAPNAFGWSYPKFEAFHSGSRAFSDLAGYSPANLNLWGEERPERVVAELVSTPYFKILGVGPSIGRTFVAADGAAPGSAPVVVLSYDLWRRRFGADSGIVGRPITVSGTVLTVIGVAPRGFGGLSGNVDLWIPMTMATVFEYPGALEEAGNHWFNVVGKLGSGVTLEQARGEALVLGKQVNERLAMPGQEGVWGATVVPLVDSRVDPAMGRAVWMLLGAVGVVLLIGCINVANLLLARGTSRQREMAIRMAVGANRFHLLRQLLVESLALSLVGGLLGMGIAWWAVRVLSTHIPAGGSGPAGVSFLFDPRQVTLDGTVTLFAVLVSVVTGLVVGTLPARQAAATSIQGRLAEGARSTIAPKLGRFGMYHLLVGFEVAMAVMLLVGAGLMLKSFANLAIADRGFDGTGVVTFRLAPADSDLASRAPQQFKAQLIDQLATLPGVTAVGMDLCPPLLGRCAVSRIASLGVGPLPPGRDHDIGVHYVTPGYFKTLSISVSAGRSFTDADRLGSRRVVLLNRTAADRLWPGQSAVGKQISVMTGYFAGGDSLAEVVGVVGDVRYNSLTEPAGADVYLPAFQAGIGRTTVLVRTSGDPLQSMESIRSRVQRLDPTLPVYGVRTMDEIAATAVARPRFATSLLLLFAGVALLLAAIGVYGVMAYVATARMREVGLRMALGAEPAVIRKLFLVQGVAAPVVGAVAGLGGAVLVSRILTGMLYQVSPLDPVVLVGAPVVLIAAAAAATLVPARRAARLSPMEVLRTE